MSEAPQSNPGDILNWPMLKISYRTDPEKIAALLPPGIEIGAEPHVNLTIYNFPVQGEPEFGLVINVVANYNGIEGEYTICLGIDQESAIYISQERWGQPKYYAETQYYRLMDYVSAKVTHQGHTFVEFKGEVGATLDNDPEYETNEWWIKCMRAVDLQPENYDYPPLVVGVRSKYGTAFKQEVKGQLILRESAWDPIATLLPMREQLSAYLWTPIFLDREITLAGQLDGKGFWPFADTIGGTRWPGTEGGPKQD
jgi:acetoacetate decarboxylase